MKMNAKVVSRTKTFEPYTLENIVNVTYSDGILVLAIADEEGLRTVAYTNEVVVTIY